MKVAVLGGGVAGLTAAHELIERGFQVEVYDWRPGFGGKSRSLKVPEKYPDLAGLPAEHGFRFFPGFYRHVIDTMKRIRPPVIGHLTPTDEAHFARVDGKPLVIPLHATPWDLLMNFPRFVEAWDLPPEDAAFFADRLLVLLTSCEGRRFGEYEYLSWWDFSDAANRSEKYQKYCAQGLSRTLVAAVPERMSTRTAGYVLLQLMFDMARSKGQVDRVLDGPTNDVWIDPWVKDLCSRGVDFHPNTMVMSLQCADKTKITGVVVRPWGRGSEADTVITADLYVCAVPCEKMTQLLTKELRAVDPTLSRIAELEVNWMNGIQLYLRKPFHGCKGHVAYADSQWALTSIAQMQFWRNVDLSKYGNGETVDILSVDVSDWFKKGYCCKIARDCTHPQLQEEVIAQLVAHLNRPNDQNFDPTNVVGSFVDEDLFDFPILLPTYPPVPITVRFNIEPLLVNTTGSWSARPRAQTRVPNLFLAADYVQTYTDLATMEGANEAARRAVNAILTATNSSKKPCRLWPLQEPAIFAPLRWIDSERYRQGLPHDPALVTWARRLLLGWHATYTSSRAASLARAVASRASSALRGGSRD